jgi:low affinity Fe/Cu permease
MSQTGERATPFNFSDLARKASFVLGTPAAFAVTAAVAVGWGAPWAGVLLLGYLAALHQHRQHHRHVPDGVSRQHTQNRDSCALHLKLGELLRSVDAARDKLINLEI